MRAQVVVVRGDEVMLARHARDGRSYWVLPGGAIEDGETPEEAARREMCEETGLAVRIERLLFVDMPRMVGNVRIREPRYTFLATILGTCGGSRRSGDETLLDLAWMPMESQYYDEATRDTLRQVRQQLEEAD